MLIVSEKVQVVSKVHGAVGDEKLDAVVCVAGGWAGGNAASPGVVQRTIHDCYRCLLYL